MSKENFEVWLSINEEGNAGVSLESGDDSRERLIEDHGGAVVRTVKLAVLMTLPEVQEAEVDVADEAGQTEEIAADAA